MTGGALPWLCQRVEAWVEHVYGHRSSPILTQPRSAPSQGKASTPARRKVRKANPHHPKGAVEPRSKISAEQEGRRADKKKGGGQREVWQNKKSHVAEPLQLHCSAQCWDL